MPRFRKRPVVIEAITFEQLVEYEKSHGVDMANGMPWSFDYITHVLNAKGEREEHIWSITHENDNCYLIPTLEGTMKFTRGDMLITGVKGEVYPCKMDIFQATYDPVN